MIRYEHEATNGHLTIESDPCGDKINIWLTNLEGESYHFAVASTVLRGLVKVLRLMCDEIEGKL